MITLRVIKDAKVNYNSLLFPSLNLIIVHVDVDNYQEYLDYRTCFYFTWEGKDENIIILLPLIYPRR